jgi:hypothetical protein
MARLLEPVVELAPPLLDREFVSIHHDDKQCLSPFVSLAASVELCRELPQNHIDIATALHPAGNEGPEVRLLSRATESLQVRFHEPFMLLVFAEKNGL